MNAFQTIIQKYYGQDKVFNLTKGAGMNSLEFLQYVYDNKYNNKTKAAGFFYYYILQILVDEDDDDDEFNYKKFNELKKLVVNSFMSETMVEELMTDFSGFQRIYNGFARLAHIYKFKKAKVQINTDLCANELNPKNSNVFVLFQNNLKYYFSARDLINMINSNLSHCIGFVPDMIVSKNPYNNVILNDTCLYNIYFFLRWNAYIIPELLHGFFLSNFNAPIFHYNYEFNIINEHVKNFIYNSHHDTLYPIFTEMWDTYCRITRKIIIDKEFPRDKLINIMKPYLHLYYTSLYATNGTYKQCNAEYTLRRKLMRFRNFNQNFGRKYIRFNRDILGKRHRKVEFDLKHINFYKSQFNNNDLCDSVQHANLSVSFFSFTSSINLPQPYRQFQTQTPDRVPSPSFDSNDDNTFGGEWYNNEHQSDVVIYQEEDDDDDQSEADEEEKEEESVS